MRELMSENGLIISSVIGASLFIASLEWMMQMCGQIIMLLFP